MSQAFMSPADFAYWVAKEGIATNGGKVKLNKYMSASISNGGSKTSKKLGEKLLPLMNKLGGQPAWKNWDRIWMGQGDINDFIGVWNWMHAHLDEVRQLKVQKYRTDDKVTEIEDGILDLGTVFKEGRPFTDCMADLMKNNCFGWDCIGFVSQYLVTIGHLQKYETWKSNHYLEAQYGNFLPIKSLPDIKPCSVIVFGDWHIVLVSSVDYLGFDEKINSYIAKVTVSQSYSGGPDTRTNCTLRQSASGGTVGQTGVIDDGASCTVGRNASIEVKYPPYDVEPRSVRGLGPEL